MTSFYAYLTPSQSAETANTPHIHVLIIVLFPLKNCNSNQRNYHPDYLSPLKWFLFYSKKSQKLYHIRYDQLRDHDKQRRFCRSELFHTLDNRQRDARADHTAKKNISRFYFRKCHYIIPPGDQPCRDTYCKCRQLHPRITDPHPRRLRNLCIEHTLHAHKRA